MKKFTPCLIAILALAEFVCRPKLADPAGRPAPELSPSDVVRIQVDALRRVDEPTPNAGIWTTFRFASPANREITGPYGHFLRVIKSPGNGPFLHARSARLSGERQDGLSAEVTVELEGRDGLRSRFTFSLSKQGPGPFKDCWMTDSVRPL
jgi:hypothetical protein